MIFCSTHLFCSRRLILGVLLLCFIATAFAESKSVRLRNEVIATSAKAARPERGNPHHGLFLVQLNGPAQADDLPQLRRLGVTLLQYVPDDAFIARAQGVRLSEVEALPFVRWTGAFKPEHKIHTRVSPEKHGNADVAVSVLLAADSTPQQLGSARGLWKKVDSQASPSFGHVWRGTVNAGQLRKLAESDAVLWVERAPRMKLGDETASKIIAGDSGTHPTLTQALGYDGSGVVVAVADSGLHLGDAELMHPDLFGRVDAFFFYGELEDASDEHSHGTHVMGIVAGNGATGEIDDYGALWGLGVAPGAHVVAQRMFDGDGGYQAPPSFGALTADAVGAGADIGSNSWGDDTQGGYDLSAMEFDALVRDADAGTPGDQPYILEFSAGNAGPGAQTVGSPAVAKNVIATGASQNDRFDYFIYADGSDAMADFSSRGPCEDGRIKPDVVAPGTWISSLRSPIGNDENAWADISEYYLFQGGTSQAGPAVSGAAAVFVQWYRDQNGGATPSPAMVKAALINSAVDMDDEVETGPIPNGDEGWGRVDLTQIIGSERNYDFVDQSVRLATGQQFERHIVVADELTPLYVTLAYTDVPGFPGSIPALVNDLDLEVIAPDGHVFRGNQFLNAESIADSPAADNLNNVECVFITAPLAGQYIVRVAARRVSQDARIDTVAMDQDFALVISARLPTPGTGFVFFDRRAYRAPGTIHVKVIDTDLQVQPSVAATVRSTSQPAGVALVLTPSGIPGTFTGSVATVTTTTAGRLRIAHNDTITTDYFDASAAATRTATARGDLVAPVITGVGTSNEFGQTVVYWRTDEPANSVVRYGTNTALNLAVTNVFLDTGHAVGLSGLLIGRTYHYVVVSEDEAGNRATNSNGGSPYQFVAVNPPTVLVVENYQGDGLGYGPDIPLSVYTNTLAQIGVSFSVWNMTTGAASPTVNTLRPYRVVIWRVSDNVFINNTLSATEQTAVQQYVQGGGSFFMASMEQLTRLSPSFVSGVLQVAGTGVDATVPSAIATPGNVITGGLALPLDYSNHETETYLLFDVPADISDTMTPSTNAFPILAEDFGGVVGVGYPKAGLDRAGRVVFLSFPLDAVSASAPAPNNRATLMQRVLNFLAPGHQGSGTITLDSTDYTLPSLARIEVADSDLAGSGQVTATVTSTAQPSGRTVTLTEFGDFGVFRGTIAVVATNGVNPSGELRATNGSRIIATYFDASRNVSVTFTSRVETVPPVISAVEIEPGYVDALVYWDTDEPADALVQYGESPLLGRTAYVDALETLHEVTLDGLEPDRAYYYRIVSRDNAGNVTVDDNGGALYTFQTLAPLSAPWSDDLEGGSTNWFVYTVEDSEMGWDYGVPQNGVAAHSGTRAWASNIGGAAVSQIESYLLSPPIYLTGGNRATLRFWQNYEFYENEEDIFHLGEVAIITDANTAPVTLEVIEGWASDGWELAEYDLTPYVGKLVYLVWHHVLFSLDYTPRQGWVIDDISVTLSNIAPGTLRVTNNLSLGSFSIGGALSVTGQGTSYLNTNAPPGLYTVTFNPVPYYTTPASVSNTLAAGATLVLGGSYGFADANTNGISDRWETNFFGGISPGRTRSTDSDADGMTDYHEFLAGTNPTNKASRLAFLAPDLQNTGVIRIDWPTVPGRSYRVLGSTDAQTWTALNAWVRAGGTILSHTVPSTNGWSFFRVEAQP